MYWCYALTTTCSCSRFLSKYFGQKDLSKTAYLCLAKHRSKAIHLSMGQVSAQGLPLAQWTSKNVLSQTKNVVHDVAQPDLSRDRFSVEGRKSRQHFAKTCFLPVRSGREALSA